MAQIVKFDCERCRMQCDMYLHGELSGDELGLFDSHISACPECAGFVSRQRDIGESLRHMTPEPQRDIARSVMERIGGGNIEPETVPRRAFKFPIATVAAVAVIAVMLYVSGAYKTIFKVGGNGGAADTTQAAGTAQVNGPSLVVNIPGGAFGTLGAGPSAHPADVAGAAAEYDVDLSSLSYVIYIWSDNGVPPDMDEVCSALGAITVTEQHGALLIPADDYQRAMDSLRALYAYSSAQYAIQADPTGYGGQNVLICLQKPQQ